MQWIEQMNKAIGYIESHLKEKIDYEAAAKICLCSLSKFQQAFHLSTGVTLSEYVRYRRMTVAASELVNTDVRIIDLANMLDYDSPEAFTRAYQMFHGVPPTITRKTKVYEEFDKIVFQMQVYGGKSKMGTNKILRIETERLIIRKFTMADWEDVKGIVHTNMKSPFVDCDIIWRSDEEGIKKQTLKLSKSQMYWAAEVKELHKVVCFICFNFMDDEKTLDIGHIINTDYLGLDYEYEALKALYNYGFLQLGADRIQATWASQYEEKLEPLYKLGMRIVENEMVDKFRADPDGKISKFERSRLIITKRDWITNPVT